ncbi:MAG TPA: hypothetical protein VGF16_11705 [Bryobacteraceae bacterium]|jgi:hypothetical protein
MDPHAETDRLRVEFLLTEFNLCLTFLEVARVELDSGGPDHARRSLGDAEKGYQTIHRFLNDRKHIDHLTAEQLASLHEKQRTLRQAIDYMESAMPRVQTKPPATSISKKTRTQRSGRSHTN